MLQHERIEVWKKTPSIYRDSLYIPDSRYVRAISIGYDMSVSDFLWLRMIQAYAGGWSKKENAEMMEQYFDVVTDLDPQFFDVYSFTIMAVGEDGQRPDLAQRVVRKGIIENPGDYRVPLEGASYASLNMADTSLAKYYTRMALLDPNHPEYLDRWLPHFDAAQGRFQLAYEKFFSDMIVKVAEGNSDVYEIVRRHLERSADSWIRSELKTRATAWREAHGGTEWPTLEQLEAEGALKGMVLPDWNTVSAIINAIMEGPASDEIVDPKVVDQIVQSSIRTWDKIPPGPNDGRNPQFNGYLLWPGGEPKEEGQEDQVILSRYAAAKLSQNMLASINMRLKHYMEENGRCATSVTEMDPVIGKTIPPLGGEFVIDTRECVVSLPPYDDLMQQVFID